MSDIINCYHQKFSGGIGDFIKGSVYLWQKAKTYGMSVDIDWKYHPIGQFINSGYIHQYDPEYVIDIEDLSIKYLNPNGGNNKDWRENTEDWIDHIFLKIIENQNLRPATISSWYSDIERINSHNRIQLLSSLNIDEECKKRFKSKINFSKDIEQLFQQTKVKNYSIIHFRLGDRHTLPNIEKKIHDYDTIIKNNYNLTNFNHDYDYYYYLIKKEIVNNNLQNVIIMSDSNDLKKFVFEQSKDRSDIHILHFNSAHTAFQPGLLKYTNFYKETNIDSYRDTALDLKYIINSNMNITYSCYYWGSGFVVWPSKIYDIPLTIKSINRC